jgi:predicted NBD/HSP70 family sugar kinase
MFFARGRADFGYFRTGMVKGGKSGRRGGARARGNPGGPQLGTRGEIFDALRYGAAQVTRTPTFDKHLGKYKLVRDLDGGLSELDPRGWGAAIAFGAGREALRAGLALPDGRLVTNAERKIFIEPPRGGEQATTDTFVACVAELVEQCIAEQDCHIAAAAIAWPGRIDHRLNDGLGDPHIFPQTTGGWGERPLAELVVDGLNRAGVLGTPPVYVINDADAELLALTQPAGRDRDPSSRVGKTHAKIHAAEVVLGVTVAGGVGGAISLRPAVKTTRRTINRGGHGFVGELGMIPINIRADKTELENKTGDVPLLKDLADDKRFPYWPGLVYKGTLDEFASGRSIIDQLPDVGADQTSEGYNEIIARTKFSRRAKTATNNVMWRAGRLIGQALAGPVLTLDPDLIVLSPFAESKSLNDGVWDHLSSWGQYIGLSNDDIVMAPDDPFRKTKGAARWAIERAVAPTMDTVCEAGIEEAKRHIADLQSRAVSIARV